MYFFLSNEDVSSKTVLKIFFVILHCTHVMITILIKMSDEMNSEIEFSFACHDFWYQHLIDIFCLQAYLKSPINYNGKTV